MKIEAKLAEMGIQPPEPSIPDTLPLRAWNVSGNLVYLSGAGPTDEAGNTPIGKVGRDFDAIEAAGFAQSIAVAHLGVLKDALGDLDRVIQIVKVLGMVARWASPELFLCACGLAVLAVTRRWVGARRGGCAGRRNGGHASRPPDRHVVPGSGAGVGRAHDSG